MMERRESQPLCGIVSEFPTRPMPSSGTHTESGFQSSSTRYARHAAGGCATSGTLASATHADSASWQWSSAGSTSAYSRSCWRPNRPRHAARRSASTTRHGRRRRGYAASIGNVAYPMEIRCNLSKSCQTPAQRLVSRITGSNIFAIAVILGSLVLVGTLECM